MREEIHISTNVESLVLHAGNGQSWNLTGLQLNGSPEFVTIQPVGKRGSVLLGGYRLHREDMRNLCNTFLEADKKFMEEKSE